MKKKGLGRGLDVLIQRQIEEDVPPGNVLEIPIDKIEPHPEQPRRDFKKEELRELSESIKTYGILSPLIVKKEGEYYTIVAGERRWRAARLAGLGVLPCILKEFDELETLEVALIENLQREDLSPLEEANSYKRLSDEFNMTQEEIAARLGKSRSAVANTMRLLGLPSAVRNMLTDNELTFGHAKALMSVKDEDELLKLAGRTKDDGLSVRELEDAIKTVGTTKDAKNTKKSPRSGYSVFAERERELTQVLGADTRIKASESGKGRIEIAFADKGELDRLLLVLRNI